MSSVRSSSSSSRVGKLLVERGLSVWSRNRDHRVVGCWLVGTAGLVGGMVHVGGMTRLTKSGLSMTDWKPFGSLPPLTLEQWQVEFLRYQQYPEWQQRQNMTLSEFKTIFYWEWGHRMMGRAVGLVFTIPWIYFSFKKGRNVITTNKIMNISSHNNSKKSMIPRSYQPSMVGLWCLGGMQGLVGWWMVKSGIGEDRFEDKHEIRVQPQRLATHLAMAFTTYSALLYTALNLFQNDNRALLEKYAKYAIKSGKKLQLMKVRQLAMATTGLTFVTVVSGALVAGNDAGRAYNVFPHMMPDGQWLPPKEELFGDPNNNNNRFKWMTHSTAYVQLQHRILGMTTATCGLGLAIAGFLYKKQLTPQARIGLYTMGGIAVSQASLGIVTLLSYVPLHLAAAHQLGSLALLTSGLFTVHSLRYISPRILTKTAAVTTRNLPYHVPLPKNILLHKHSPV